MIIGLDHIQLAMPEGSENRARAYYADLLGIPEVKKPIELQARGGCWFESDKVAVHLGIENTTFVPAKKAHPAFQVISLEDIRVQLEDAGYHCSENEALLDFVRFYSEDPFGNRIEFLEKNKS